MFTKNGEKSQTLIFYKRRTNTNRTMKTLLTALLLGLASCSCEENNNKLIEWINTHPKPIKTERLQNGLGETFYTITDSAGQVYYSGAVNGVCLPDVIKKTK